MDKPMSVVQEAKAHIAHLLAEADGVNGIGLTWAANNTPAVLVNVEKGAKRQVRRQLRGARIGVPVIIKEVGPITFED